MSARLSDTVHLQSLKPGILYLKADLYRLAADLAVFDVGLATGSEVKHYFHEFCAIGAADPAFNNSRFHSVRS